MTSIRAFFSVIPPPFVRDLLASTLKILSESTSDQLIKWVDFDHLHVTLQFIQSSNSEQVPLLIERTHTELKNTPAFHLELGHLEWFPSPKHPKILSLTVSPQDVLMALSTTIGHALSFLNLPGETRPFRGHMSLGRSLDYSVKKEEILQKIKLPIIPPILINELYLIESKPKKSGSDYSTLAQFNLI